MSGSHRRVKHFELIFVFLFCFLVDTICDSQRTERGIERFRSYQRRCFKVAPCVLFANERGSFGCAQCSERVIRRPVIEFFTRNELLAYLSTREIRIVMIPEFLFFEQSVLSALETAPNIAALVVYSGDSPNNKRSYPLPYPPVSQASEDFVEPNYAYNYYPEIVNSTDGDEPNIKDYSDPSRILEAIVSGDYTFRNGFGTGLKFRLFNYNIFHVSDATASDIRRAMQQFENGEQRVSQGVKTGSSSTSPSFKLESIGRMYACPSASPTGSPSPSPTESNPSPPILEATPEQEFSVRQGNDIGSEEDLSIATSAKCLSEQTCLPIGGQSLWSSLGRIQPRVRNNGSVIPNSDSPKILAVMAPMDSMAFFPDMAYGASAEIASLASLLAVSEAVGSYWRTMLNSSVDSIKMQPVYFAWNAQSWGWAGSSRFLKDLSNFECINETDNAPGCKGPFMPSLKFFDMKDWISKAINIGQLISPNTTDYFDLTKNQTSHMFLHSFDEKKPSSLQTDFSDQHQIQGDNDIKLIVNPNDAFSPLDASQSFKQFYPPYNNSAFEIISITNYEKNFSNRYFHSIFDHRNLTTIGENYRQPLYATARLISAVVIQTAFGVSRDQAARVDIRKQTIDEVIECMTANWTECKLKTYLPEVVAEDSQNVIPGNYAGSYFPATRLEDTSPTWAAKIALLRNFLAYHNRYNVSEPVSCTTEDQCRDVERLVNANITMQTDWQTVFCVFEQCVFSDTHTHDAFGTAIEAEIGGNRSSFKYAPDTDVTKPLGAAWTESAWDDSLGLCGFVEDSVLYGILILAAGVMVFAVSAASVYFLDSFMNTRLKKEPTIALTRDLVPP